MATYRLISSVIVGAGNSSSIEFTSIPSTYTDLCLKFSFRDSRTSQGPGYLKVTFNDIGTSYSSKVVYTSTDDGAVVNSTRGDNYLSFAINTNFATASTFGNAELYIPNYAGSASKSMTVDSVCETNHAFNAATRQLTAFLWSNSAAITKIAFTGDSMPFLQHSSAYLYGISNA